VVMTLGHWDGDLWHSLSFCNGIATPAGCIFHPVTAEVGLLSSSDRRAHFSPGTESKVASIEVRWPSEIVRSVTEMAADQVLKIERPPK
jgi:hypothetical protein